MNSRKCSQKKARFPHRCGRRGLFCFVHTQNARLASGRGVRRRRVVVGGSSLQRGGRAHVPRARLRRLCAAPSPVAPIRRVCVLCKDEDEPPTPLIRRAPLAADCNGAGLAEWTCKPCLASKLAAKNVSVFGNDKHNMHAFTALLPGGALDTSVEGEVRPPPRARPNHLSFLRCPSYGWPPFTKLSECGTDSGHPLSRCRAMRRRSLRSRSRAPTCPRSRIGSRTSASLSESACRSTPPAQPHNRVGFVGWGLTPSPIPEQVGPRDELRGLRGAHRLHRPLGVPLRPAHRRGAPPPPSPPLPHTTCHARPPLSTADHPSSVTRRWVGCSRRIRARASSSPVTQWAAPSPSSPLVRSPDRRSPGRRFPGPSLPWLLASARHVHV